VSAHLQEKKEKGEFKYPISPWGKGSQCDLQPTEVKTEVGSEPGQKKGPPKKKEEKGRHVTLLSI